MKFAVFVSLLFLGAIAYAQPATKPAEEKHETLAEIKAKELAQSVADVAALPVIQAKRIDDVVKLSIKGKDLVVSTTLSLTDDARVNIPGLAGIARVKYT